MNKLTDMCKGIVTSVIMLIIIVTLVVVAKSNLLLALVLLGVTYLIAPYKNLA